MADPVVKIANESNIVAQNKKKKKLGINLSLALYSGASSLPLHAQN